MTFSLDLKITNARITTLDNARPQATTIGILGGRIIGFDSEVVDLPATKTIDAQGLQLLPGFHDAHCHTVLYGRSLNQIDFIDAANPQTILDFISSHTGDGWIIGHNLRAFLFDDNMPHRSELDKVSRGKPLLISFTSRHGVLANTAALELAGLLDPSYQCPAGGKVDYGPDGTPSGTVHETAQVDLLNLANTVTREDIEAAIERATAAYAKEGIVGFSEAGVNGGITGHGPEEIQAYQNTYIQGNLHARAQLMPAIDALIGSHTQTSDHLSNSQSLLLHSAQTGFGNDWLSFGHTKLFFDGALTSETAAMTTPYRNSDSKGLLTEQPSELLRRAHLAYQNGWALAIHAIGDAAVDTALDVIESCQERWGKLTVANRVEHGGVVRDDQLARMKALQVGVTPQTAFFHDAGQHMLDHLEPERHRELYRAKSFLDAGIPLGGSSDRPCVDGTASRCIESFTNRAGKDGSIIGSINEALSPMEALYAYTMGSAELAGLSESRGSLKPGKLADLVFATESESPDNENTWHGFGEVIATMVEGRFTFGENAV